VLALDFAVCWLPLIIFLTKFEINYNFAHTVSEIDPVTKMKIHSWLTPMNQHV